MTQQTQTEGLSPLQQLDANQWQQMEAEHRQQQQQQEALAWQQQVEQDWQEMLQREADYQRQLDEQRQRAEDERREAEQVQRRREQRQQRREKQQARRAEQRQERAEQQQHQGAGNNEREKSAQAPAQSAFSRALSREPPVSQEQDFMTYYYTGVADKKVQASFGIDPSHDLTPAGVVMQVQIKQGGNPCYRREARDSATARDKLSSDLKARSPQQLSSARQKLEDMRQLRSQEVGQEPSRVRQQMAAQRGAEPVRSIKVERGLSR